MKMHAGECCKFSVNHLEQIIHLTVHLISFSLQNDVWLMSTLTKHEIAFEMKKLGTESLKCKNYLIAAEKYGLALKLLLCCECVHTDKAQMDLIIQIRLNLSLCFMKINVPEGVLHHCNSVLGHQNWPKDFSDQSFEDYSYLIKVLYRRAWALCQINEFAMCKEDVSKILKYDPENKEAVQLASHLDSKIKQSDRVMSNNLRNMFR